jgi:aldose 1-epimerase
MVDGLDTIELRLGAVMCRVAPALGGALLSLEIDGVDVLRRSSGTPADILETACFSLIPFANRIANGRFCFAGTDVSLPADPATPPHAHHGHGWRVPWTVARCSLNEAELTYLHPADRWPWTYRATQRLKLLPQGLALELETANLTDQPMPCGAGLHPYFALTAGSYITVDAPVQLRPDARGIPLIEAPGLTGPQLLSEIPPSDDLLLDRSGRALVGACDWEIALTADQAIGWQFYLPPSREFFCLEPVSHRPDSWNQPGAPDTVPPGRSRRWQFAITRTR